MNQLMTIAQAAPLTMSSREIAELCEKRHDNVMADCRKLADFYAETYSPEKSGQLVKSITYTDSTGRVLPCFELDKQASLDLVTGYSLPHRHAVNKRWQELEAQQAPAFAIPKTLPEALRLAADLSEQNERLALERDEAVRTKAEIGSRREATAMATAAAKAKEVARLKHELGRNQQHATVVAVEKATGRRFAKNAYVALRRITREYGLQAVSVMDPRYGSVKAWPAIAWREAYGIDLQDLFPGAEAA